MRVAICGGTFDPFHNGHIEPLMAVRAEMGWSRIVFMPAWRQPFKEEEASASGYHRYAMAVLAASGHDGVVVSPWELERGRVSYSVETLEQMHRVAGGASIDWVIGDDNLARLTEWRALDRILELANFVVLERGGGTVPEPLQGRVAPAAARGAAGSIVFAANRTVPVSSTEIRRRLRDGEPVGAFVHPLVSRYIDQHQLYRTESKGTA